VFKKVILGIIFWGITFNATVHADHFNLYLSQIPVRQINVKDQFNTLYRSNAFLSYGIELETSLNEQMQWALGILHSPDQKYTVNGGQAIYSSTSYYYKLKYALTDFQDYRFYVGGRVSLEFASAQGFTLLEGVDVGTGAGILIGVESDQWFGEFGYFFSTPTLRFTPGFTDSYQEQTELKIGYRIQFNFIDLFPAN
jgi:hypothetical protein